MTGFPAVFEYQRALEAFRRGHSDASAVLKSMSELISLLDLTTTLSSGSSTGEILDAALLTVLGELAATRGVLLSGARMVSSGSAPPAVSPHRCRRRRSPRRRRTGSCAAATAPSSTRWVSRCCARW